MRFSSALRLACVRAYNDFRTEWASADSRRLLPVAAMPFWDIDASVAGVRRCAEMGHRGVLWTGEPARLGAPHLGDHAWDPFYAAGQDAGLPISFHIGGGEGTLGGSADRIKAHGYRGCRLLHGRLYFGNGM